MLISRVERQIGPKELGHVQRVTSKMVGLKYVQIGETVEHGTTTFRETIIKGHNYFKRFFCSFNKKGERIKNSGFSEELFGEEANKKPVRHFGVWG